MAELLGQEECPCCDDAEYQAALKDVGDLAGCLEDTKEEKHRASVCRRVDQWIGGG